MYAEKTNMLDLELIKSKVGPNLPLSEFLFKYYIDVSLTLYFAMS